MASIAVKSHWVGFENKVTYELNIVILVHYAELFKRRVDYLKEFGLLNTRGRKLHLTLLASEGDGIHEQDIAAGWPAGIHVTLLEMSSCEPIPKINGYYLWLATARLNARWHLRVDDDSINDIDGLLNYADTHFPDCAVHLMTMPIMHAPHYFVEFLEANNLEMTTYRGEYEASLTSNRAMQTMFANPRAMSFLEETAQRFLRPGDVALAMAMHICGVPAAGCPIMTKDFRHSELSLLGGPFCHVHYVEWDDLWFTRMLRAILRGERKPFTDDFIRPYIGHCLPFGRCIGDRLDEIVLCAGGRVESKNHSSEERWVPREDALLLCDATGVATVVLHTILRHDQYVWLMGPHLHDRSYRFIELEGPRYFL